MSVAIPIIIAFLSMFVPGVLLALALLKGTRLHLPEILAIGFIFGMVAPATLTWLDSYLMGYFHFLAFSLGLFEANALIITVVGALLCWREGVFSDIINGLKGNVRQEKAAVEHERRAELSDIRSRLSGFEKARALVDRHEMEEQALRKKHAEELKLVSSFNEDERRSVLALHSKDELALEERHVHEEAAALAKLEHEPAKTGLKAVPMWVWVVLLALVAVTFATRIVNIGVSSTYFQFDPYFDMLNAQRIVALGYQPLNSPSAWPAMVNGTVTRVQPLIPYLEAYWYALANHFGSGLTTFNTTLMADVSGFYPPIIAALLVFIIFMLLYREYDEYVALIGAALAASIPILFTTFVAGQQLLQPWGIFSLFFFFAVYMLAIKDKKSVRLAVLAGIAFATTFLGAHYYTVDAGVLALYIVIQGMISYLRGGVDRDFYKMNIIVIVVIGIFLAVYTPYNAVYGGGLPSVLGIPITVALPALALVFVGVIDLLPVYLSKHRIVFKDINFRVRIGWLVLILLIAGLALLLTPLGSPINSLINESVKFTTPSTPLFMTVQEYSPTGLLYDFGASGLGLIAASAFGFPFMVYVVLAIAAVLLLIGIFCRKSDTSVFYLLIAFPLAIAAFSEVAYIPHFSAAYVMLFGIIIGEIGVLAGNDFKLDFSQERRAAVLLRRGYDTHKDLMFAVFAVALFFLQPIVAMVFLLAVIFMHKADRRNYLWALFVLFIIIEGTSIALGSTITGEASSLYEAFAASATYAANPAQACTALSNANNGVGVNMFCNTIPQYWLNAMQFIKENVGPNGPRVLSWWDYGDWINWFGQSPAVLRGDNSVPKEDFATAASFVLGAAGLRPVDAGKPHEQQPDELRAVRPGPDRQVGRARLPRLHKHKRDLAGVRDRAGGAAEPAEPYVLGTSQCERSHDPQFILVPLPALAPSLQPAATSTTTARYREPTTQVRDTRTSSWARACRTRPSA